MAMYPHSGMGPSGGFPPNMSAATQVASPIPDQNMQGQMQVLQAQQQRALQGGMGQGGIEQFLQPFLQQMQQQHQQEMQGKIQPYVQEVKQLTNETFPDASSMQSIGGLGQNGPASYTDNFNPRQLVQAGVGSMQGGLQGKGSDSFASSFFNSPQYQSLFGSV
tara:strand:- start:291 stop:779 length:489 start_codon:yes stop_codon:yes gene_type:complete